MSALRQLQRNDFLWGWVRVGLPKCLLLINAFSQVIICSKQMNSSQCLWAGSHFPGTMTLWKSDTSQLSTTPPTISPSPTETHWFIQFIWSFWENSASQAAWFHETVSQWTERNLLSIKNENRRSVLAGLCKKPWFSQASAGLALLGLSKICQSELTQIRFLTR